jgi:hypothetical protein
MTLAEAQAQRDLIVKSLGQTGVEMGDKRLSYTTDSEKLKAIQALDGFIAELGGGSGISGTASPTSRTTYTGHSRG